MDPVIKMQHHGIELSTKKSRTALIELDFQGEGIIGRFVAFCYPEGSLLKMLFAAGSLTRWR